MRLPPSGGCDEQCPDPVRAATFPDATGDEPDGNVWEVARDHRSVGHVRDPSQRTDRTSDELCAADDPAVESEHEAIELHARRALQPSPGRRLRESSGGDAGEEVVPVAVGSRVFQRCRQAGARGVRPGGFVRRNRVEALELAIDHGGTSWSRGLPGTRPCLHVECTRAHSRPRMGRSGHSVNLARV